MSTEIEQAKADGDYHRAIRAARATYEIFPSVVRQWKREYQSWDIATSHAIDTASTLMAVVGDREAIAEMRATVEAIPDLRRWLPVVDDAESEARLVDGILAAVAANPGLAQSELKHLVEAEKGRRLSTLAAWLEKGARLLRVKKGTTYQLYPAGYRVAVSPLPSWNITGRPGVLVLRSPPGRAAIRAREIDLGSLQYVRLPKAPAQWEERQRHEGQGNAERASGSREPSAEARVDRIAAPMAETHFSVNGDGWEVADEGKLAPSDRPNPAYTEVFPTGGSTFWLDPKGHREGFEGFVSVLRVTDRAGELLAERGLSHDVYRADVSAQGSGAIFMSREGVLHSYSDSLEQILAERVADLPEYQAQAARLGIEPRQLKNHTRSVALSADRSRYLITFVDEAWCLSVTTGEVLWGLRFPTKEGWTRVVTSRSDRSGTSAEVEAALHLMELELPVTPPDIIRQYRRFAMRWHPDRNPGDIGATRRFQELGAAMELLTGTDLSGIGEREIEEVTYQKILGRQRIRVPVQGAPGGSLGIEVTLSMGTSERQVADWIYASNFASSDNRAFLAGYSGTVVEVSDEGIPLRAYDIGAVPRHIEETDTHLYLLTDTRLYVLSGDRLEAVVDVFGKGDLVIGDTGFGLLESKAFTWFTSSGRRVGGVYTKDPIRRVLSAPHGLVVETRQHRATVSGTPSWWRV